MTESSIITRWRDHERRLDELRDALEAHPRKNKHLLPELERLEASIQGIREAARAYYATQAEQRRCTTTSTTSETTTPTTGLTTSPG